MRPVNVIKISVPLLLAAMVLLFPSCEDNLYLGEVDCRECYTEKPTHGKLVVQLTVNDDHPRIPVTIYRGEWEKQFIEFHDTVNTMEMVLSLPVDNYYSVAAEYRVNGKTIIAIDGDYVKASKSVGKCDESCWIIVDGWTNAMLRPGEKFQNLQGS